MKRLITAVDLDEPCEDLLAYTAGMARAYQAQVKLIYVAPPEPDFIGYDPGPQSVRDNKAHELKNKHQQLQRMAEQLQSNAVQAEALVVQSAAAEGILKQAREWKADLILIRNHAHNLLYKALAGSVTERLLQHADCPVLLLPPRS